MSDTENINAILPRQYIGKWKNEEGTLLRVVFYLDEDSRDLKKLFIPFEEYKALEIKNFLGKKVELQIGEDDEGRPSLLGLTDND